MMVMILIYYYYREDVWGNSAFSPKFANTQSEGTYVADVVLPLLRAALKDVLADKRIYLST
jgi:hypothetical protein